MHSDWVYFYLSGITSLYLKHKLHLVYTLIIVIIIMTIMMVLMRLLNDNDNNNNDSKSKTVDQRGPLLSIYLPSLTLKGFFWRPLKNTAITNFPTFPILQRGQKRDSFCKNATYPIAYLKGDLQELRLNKRVLLILILFLLVWM